MREKAGAESWSITKQKAKRRWAADPFPNRVSKAAMMAVLNFTFQISERSQRRVKAPEMFWVRGWKAKRHEPTAPPGQ